MTKQDWTFELPADLKRKLPEGEYPFKITSLNRREEVDRYGNQTLVAEMDMLVDGDVEAKKVRLYVSRSYKNMRIMAAFFECIGQKKPGQAFTPDWSDIVGHEGRAVFKPKVLDRGGTVYNVESWLPYDPFAVTATEREAQVAAGEYEETAYSDDIPPLGPSTSVPREYMEALEAGAYPGPF